MIVASKFDGDENEALMLAQHDVYRASLNIITEGCFCLRRQSMAVLGKSEDVLLPESFADISYDHRNFQDGHDHLAAYWRKHSDKTFPDSLFEDQNHVAEWHGWLLAQVRDWFFDKPELVVFVTRILAAQKNQNVAQIMEVGFVGLLQETYDLSD